MHLSLRTCYAISFPAQTIAVFAICSPTIIVHSAIVAFCYKMKKLNNLHLMKQQQKRLLNVVVKALRVEFSAD